MMHRAGSGDRGTAIGATEDRGPGRRGVAVGWLLVLFAAGCGTPPPEVLEPLEPAPEGGGGAGGPGRVSIDAAAQLGAEYRIRRGDLLEVSVAGDPDTAKIVPVGPDGRLSYLYVGDVEAAGRTFQELREEIEMRLREGEIYREPHVAVLGREFAGNTVSILGAVKSPGRLVLTQETRLMDVIAQAGGFERETSGAFEQEVADLAGAVLIRGDRVVDLDFRRLFGTGAPDLSQNIAVQGGDTVYVPSFRNRLVYILGEVGSPRAVRYWDGLTVLGAIVEAGGFNTRASPGHVVVVRGGVREPRPYRANVSRIQTGRSSDIPLSPGDIVYVPASAVSRLQEISAKLIPVFNAVILEDQALRIGEARW